eukprot:5674204-Lingulodinium_polyedra.AAC.1
MRARCLVGLGTSVVLCWRPRGCVCVVDGATVNTETATRRPRSTKRLRVANVPQTPRPAPPNTKELPNPSVRAAAARNVFVIFAFLLNARPESSL